MIKKIYLYFSGQIQYISKPKLLDYLCILFTPIYIGNYKYKWCGITFNAPDSLGGETIFMYWRRKRND